MLNNKIVSQFLAWLLMAIFILMPAPAIYANDLDTVKRILITDYYRTLSTRELSAASLEELLTRLDDPHTFVMNIQEGEEFLDSIEGDLVLIGIGITETRPLPLAETSHHTYVVDVVLKDSAAEAAGIRTGDRLTAIDGALTDSMTLEQVYKQLNKPIGVAIKLTLQRGSQTLFKEVTPQAYNVPTITSKMLEGDILYIHLLSMGRQIDQEMNLVLQQHPNFSGIILDLTGNSGGYIYSTRSLADLLLQEGRFMGLKNKNYLDWLYLIKPAAYEQPLICLVDKDSASAAEILPAVLQDYSRALIVGETTYGKFSSQSILPVSEELLLKYTFAQVLTPQGRNLDHLGLIPDIELDRLTAVQFAYTLLLQTIDTNKKHALIIDPDTAKAYLDAKTLHSSEVLIQDETNYIKLRDAASAMKLFLEWDPGLAQARLWHNGTSHLINPESPEVIWQEGSLYIAAEQLAQYVLGDLSYENGNILLYYN